MLEVILVLLVLLWLTGNLHINGITFPNAVLFSINGQAITLINVLIFFIIVSAIGLLPTPFREVAGVLFVLWLLSILGFLAIAGLSNIIVIAIIIGVVIAVLGK